MSEEPICGRLIACDALLGLPYVPPAAYQPDVADLEAEMARLHISASVVRHRSSLQASPYFGNRALMEEIAGHGNLLPAWFLTPDGCEPAFDPAAVVDEMLARGVRLAWSDPVAVGFSLQPWCSGGLLAALQEHRVPLLLDYEQVPANDLALALSQYPQLRVIMHNVPRLGRNRLLMPLLDSYPELYLCFGPSFSVQEGHRYLCNRYGPHRWVWGAGYPSCEGGAGITGLVYAGLTEAEMQAVAHGNLERLLAEVQI